MTEEDKVSPESESAAKSSAFKGKEKREKSRPLTKIVCRRLPPSMEEEDFMEQVSPIPEHDYFYFAKPDPSLTPDLFSRAYINFVNVEDIFLFRDKFDDYIFLDDKGNEFPAIVEYAPFQRLPKKRRKKDPKSGTIESDSTYLEFLESLKETDSDSREPKMEYSYQPTEEKKETTTPLLEFLAAKKRDERRRREDRQRRRPRNRKEDDIPEEDVKKIKPRDEKEKSFIKKKEEDSSWADPGANGEPKDSKYVKSVKPFRENRKSVDDHRKKSDFEKKSKDVDTVNDEKVSRRDRKDRQRETPKKEVKKYSDSRKDKPRSSEKRSEKLPSFRKIEETEQDDIIGASLDSKVIKSSIIPSTSECLSDKSKNSKAPLISSNIKPFTQLPQYKVEDLTKVIEELDKSTNKKIIETNKSAEVTVAENDETTPIADSDSSDPKANVIPTKLIREESTSKRSSHEKSGVKEISKHSRSSEKKLESFKKVEDCSDNVNDSGDVSQQQRRSSLESSEKRPSTDDAPLRRHKSLDDKSEDPNDDDSKESSHKHKSADPRTERRIKNKDRPSIAIYKPGMGRFSKQRIEREKDTPTGTYKPLDPNVTENLTEE